MVVSITFNKKPSSFNGAIEGSYFGIYQGFTASAEGYPYKILDLLAGTLLI
jgi:hypothetical protein